MHSSAQRFTGEPTRSASLELFRQPWGAWASATQISLRQTATLCWSLKQRECAPFSTTVFIQLISCMVRSTPELRGKVKRCGCYDWPVLSVLTINRCYSFSVVHQLVQLSKRCSYRVQEIFRNPVYQLGLRHEGAKPGTTDCEQLPSDAHQELLE